MTKPELTLILPTYNEADIVLASLSRIANDLGGMRAKTEIIFADDGTDDLPAVIEREGTSLGFDSIRVMRNLSRLGKGKSTAKAVYEAMGGIVGFLDIDLSVAPSYIPHAVTAIQQGSDISIGSRIGNRWKIDWSIATSAAGTLYTFVHRRILFAGMQSFPDTQCGFKFFKHDVAKDLFGDLVAKDGLFDMEVLLKAVKAGYTVKEIPVPRVSDRAGKRPLSKIFVRETLSLGRIFCKYKLGI